MVAEAKATQRARSTKPAAPPARDHIAIARQFEEDVLAGRFSAGRFFRLAVERQRRDLERAKVLSWGFKFDEERAGRACRFVELLCHVEGPDSLVGTPFVMQPWQVWLTSTVFGWCNRVSGNPRFRRAVLFMPKGQGKTFLAAAWALYALATGRGADTIVSAATTREQAALSFRTARSMLMRLPRLVDKFGLVTEEHKIKRPGTGGCFFPISSEARSVEGKLPRLTIVDEIHVWGENRDLWDNLRSMAAKRPDSQTVVISTAGLGMSPGSIGYEVYTVARDLLEQKIWDDSQFALLIEADRDRDPFDLETVRQANPNFGISIDPIECANELAEAKRLPTSAPSYFVKRLGWWQQSTKRWLDVARWSALHDPSLTMDAFADEAAFIGVDLAHTRDLTAIVCVYVSESEDDDRRHYSVFSRAYLPEESITLHQGNDALRVWADQGWLVLTPGEAMDYNLIRKDLLELCEKFPGSEVCYDPWSAQQLANELQDAGVTCVETRQGAKTQSEPMKELEAAIVSGRVHHDGSPVMTWCLGNVLAKADANGNIRPDKEAGHQKIDCAVALINAMVRATLGASSGYALGDDYEFMELGDVGNED